MAETVRVTFLGGLGDIGRNCATIETDDAVLILDCGQLFAGEDRPGVDSVLPDLRYLTERSDKIVGLIATHGHEDHIGAIGYAFESGLRFSIYGSPFTIGLIRHRLEERGFDADAELHAVSDFETVDIGPFHVEFLPVTHSVPGGLISAITTPQGVIVHSSDFKLDLRPIDGRHTALTRLGAIAHDQGVRLLLADSTNSEQPGSSRSESDIGVTIEQIFKDNTDRRIICAAFSSHIHRVQQVIEAALAQDRVIATMGLSMKRNVALARDLGLLSIPDPSIVDIADVDEYEPHQVCVITTGAQGEARAALSQAAIGRNRWLTVGDHDTIILSSHPIPGNEARISAMINGLIRRGAVVVHSSDAEVHTSGHGKQNELATLHAVTSPEWFVPVHGEHRHLKAHADLARSLGLSHVLEAVDGDCVMMTDDGLFVDQQVIGGDYLLAHGPFIRPDRGVTGDRAILSQGGFVSAFVLIDPTTYEPAVMPHIESRGWIEEADAQPLQSELAQLLYDDLMALAARENDLDQETVVKRTRRCVGQFVNDRTNRRPMIVPIVQRAIVPAAIET